MLFRSPKKLIASPIIAKVNMLIGSLSNVPKPILSKGVSSSPPAKPSMVLLGLILGSIFRLPRLLPVRYWNISLSSVVTTREITHNQPWGSIRKKVR